MIAQSNEVCAICHSDERWMLCANVELDIEFDESIYGWLVFRGEDDLALWVRDVEKGMKYEGKW